jgi:hexosaminidase
MTPCYTKQTVFAFGMMAAAVCHAAVNPAPQVVPAVRQWTGGEGTLSVRESSINVYENDEKQLMPVAKALQADLAAIGMPKQDIHSANMMGSGQINLGLTTARMPPGAEDKLGTEGYVLAIDDRVTISAKTATGVYHGTRTLLQMLAKDRRLPRGTIVDHPSYRHRMLMLDVGRKPFPLEVLKDYLRIMSWYKMNELHLHLSDEAFGGAYAGFRVQCDTYPGLASTDCFYTKKQLRELQDMAAGMGITITPEIDMPGHARVFTNYWPDLKLKGYPNYLDVTNPRTIERLKRLLDEMIPIFDAPDFHIGTDEYRVGGPDREKLHEAFRQFINTMNAHIRSKGKNCRIWSGFENMKGTTRIDPSVIIDMWETRNAKAQIAEGHSIINSSDGRTYIVPGAHYYGVSNAGIYNSWEPWMVSGDPAMNPSPDDPKLLGGKLHVWNDQGPTGYTMNEIARLALPSIQVFAEKLWGSKGSKDFTEFQKRAELVSKVPGVKVFERSARRAKDGHVLSRAAEMTLATRDSNVANVGPSDCIDADGKFAYVDSRSQANLEYPWTLSVDVFKTTDSGTRGVILSSDLAEICADYSRNEDVAVKGPDGKNVKKKVSRRGVGVVRAAGAPGKDAASSHLVNDVSRVYSDPLPLNQWTTLTIVGQQRRTKAYINGQKVGESGEQMLCPLARLGSKTGQSFVGKLRNLKVWDRALNPKEIGRTAGLNIPDNLAAHCPVTASASDAEHGFTPENATDEELGTRWSSGMTSADQWVAIDLKKPVEFNTVTVAWETARPKKLRIQVPQGQDSWKDVCDIDVAGDKTVATFPTVQAGRVRLLMSKPTTQWGYSIWEVEVWNDKKAGKP